MDKGIAKRDFSLFLYSYFRFPVPYFIFHVPYSLFLVFVIYKQQNKLNIFINNNFLSSF